MDFLLSNLDSNEIVEIDENMLEEFWKNHFENPHDIPMLVSKRIFIDTFKSQIPELQNVEGSLFLSTKSFRVPIYGSLAKSTIIVSFLTSAFSQFDISSIPPAMACGMLWNLFSIERVQLKLSDGALVAEIPFKKKHKEYLSPKKLYGTLPEELKSDLNYVAFCDFLERLELAGFAKRKDDKYIIFKKGRNRFKVKFV